jgi:ABC-type polysaccharide/polyol phosphate export permease
MTPSIATSLSELPEYRQVLANLIARDLKVKYQVKALGFAWSLLAPAAMLAILYTIFSHAFKVNMPDYWAFLVAGILPFQFISESIVTGANSIRQSAGLIRKVYIPMEILVIASITVRTIEFVLQMLLAAALLMALHHGMGVKGPLTATPVPPPVAGAPHAMAHPAAAHPQQQHPAQAQPLPPSITRHVSHPPHFAPLKTAVVLPGAILLSYLFVLGLSMPLAAWCVIYKDLDHIITIVMRVLFYATPVFWAVFQMQSVWARYSWLNPVANMLALFRAPMYWGAWPFNEALSGGSMHAWGICIVSTVVVLIGGYLLFNRSKRILAEVV